MSQQFKINIPISKIDEEQRTVYGVATTESIDSQMDVVDYEASKIAFDAWLGNIREMHQPIAVGKAIDIQYDDDKKQVTIGAKISESTDGENAWIKVKEQVLQGFSIGGSIKQISKEVVKDKNGVDQPVSRIIDYDLYEVSLVDTPANPDAMFVMVKSAEGGLQRVEENLDSDQIHKGQHVPYWLQQFMPPMEKAQALYDKSMKKAGVAVVDSDPRDADGNTVTEVVTGTAPVKPNKVLKPVYGKDGRTVTIKSKGADMKKGMWDAATLLDLAMELNWYIQGEQYEGEDVADLQGALATIKQAVIKELTEPTEELTVAVELAQKLSDLKKEKAMSTDKKVEKSTAVAGGEERDANADVVTTAEENGRPLNDTDERAADAGVKPAVAGEPAVHADGTAAADAAAAKDDQNAEDTDAKPAVNDAPAAPAADEAAEDDKASEDKKDDGAKADEADDKSTKADDSEKSVTVGDLRKFTDSLISKIGESNKSELSKALGELSDEVEKTIEKAVTPLKDRIKQLEDQPAAIKSRASYHTVDKGGSASEEEADVAELLKRRDELAADPKAGTPQERRELSLALRKAQQHGANLSK